MPQADCLAVGGDGRIELPLVPQRNAEVVVGLGYVGSQGDRLAINVDRLVELPCVLQGKAEVAKSFGVVGPDGDGATKGFDGGIDQPVPLQHDAKIEEGFGVIGPRGDGLADQIDCNVIASDLMGDQSQMVQCGRMARLPGQDLPVQLLGLLQPTGLVLPQSQFERLLDRGLVHSRDRHCTGSATRSPGDTITAMPQLTIQGAFQIAVRDHQGGRLAHAEHLYRQILAIEPRHPDALHNLGLIAHQTGRHESAVDLIRRAIALKPGDGEAYYNLGIALHALGRSDEAIAANRQAIALKPDSSDAHRNLGVALKAGGQLDDAIAAYNRAIALNPDDADTHSDIAIALADQGRIDEAIAAHRRAVSLDPDSREIGSNFILAMHYHPGLDAQTIAGEHHRWSGKHAEPLRKFIQPHVNDRSPDRRLRIGYVSPDFKHHAVAPMVLPLLACHDREKFQVFCYAQVRKPDAMTERFRAEADQWRSTFDLNDEQLAALIRQDQIDILVDLAGHTAGGRLLVFARKPAPVQIARQGYPDTTGLSTMDYRMTDAYADPPGLTDALHSERLIRLPRTNWIYQPPEDCPTPDHRPAGAITFGCFNSFAKVTESMLLLWARILMAVPDSRLLLKAPGLRSQSTQQRVRALEQRRRSPRAAGIAGRRT